MPGGLLRLVPQVRGRIGIDRSPAGEPRPGVHRYYGLWLRLWPAKRELVAHAGFHGSWPEWLA